METVDITLSLRLASSVRELQKHEKGEWVRNMGLLYFHQLEDGGIVPHVVSPQTNGEWLIKMVRQNRIYLTKPTINAEKS